MKKRIKPIIIDTMSRNARTRDNDNLLIAKVLREIYGTSDLAEIAEITSEGVCESITRSRRIIQQTMPYLASSPKTTKARKRRQETYRELKGDYNG